MYPDDYCYCSSFITDIQNFCLIYNSLLSDVLLFSSFKKQVCWQLILLVFLYLILSSFLLYSWGIFLLDVDSWVDGSFFHHLQYVISLLSGLHNFWWEICSHWNWFLIRGLGNFFFFCEGLDNKYFWFFRSYDLCHNTLLCYCVTKAVIGNIERGRVMDMCQ